MIQFAVLWPIVCGIGKYVLEIPLVHRGIENYFAGTKTVWDGLAWSVFEKFAHIKSPEERGAAVTDGLAKVQAQYDEVKARVADGAPEHEAIEAVTGINIRDLMGNGQEPVAP